MIVLGIIVWLGGLCLWMRFWNKKVVKPIERKLREKMDVPDPVTDVFLNTEAGRKMARACLLLKDEGKDPTPDNFRDAYRRANGVE